MGSMAYDAVLHDLAVGEAVKSLPEEFKQQHAHTLEFDRGSAQRGYS